MKIIIAIVIGGVVGWIASLIMKTNAQMGVLANVCVGIVGSWLGGWLAPALGIVPTGGIGRWAVALGGAVLLIWALKVLKVLR